MADYFSPTVIQPTIPSADMTPLERLLLGKIFSAEPGGDGVYFCADERPADMIWVGRTELEAALATSRSAQSEANAYVAEQVAKAPLDADEIELDLSGTSWEFIFQDIVRRSSTLDHVTAVTSFTCSRMRPDGFGGMAVLITADAIKGKSTDDILCELLDEAEPGALATAPGFGVHVLLRLGEANVRKQIEHLIEAGDTLTIAADAVTDADIRTGCLAVVDRTDLTEERAAEFRAALAAIHEAEHRRSARTLTPGRGTGGGR
jgi:hypothetical protein